VNVQRKTPPRYPVVDEAIKERGSVAAFVREADVNQQTYYAMQSGRTMPTLSLVYKVLDYTGLTFDQAFGRG
jgi:DNA-binding XRE family transcriptional regulator